jgi:hypothetical protein
MAVSKARWDIVTTPISQRTLVTSAGHILLRDSSMRASGIARVNSLQRTGGVAVVGQGSHTFAWMASTYKNVVSLTVNACYQIHLTIAFGFATQCTCSQYSWFTSSSPPAWIASWQSNCSGPWPSQLSVPARHNVSLCAGITQLSDIRELRGIELDAPEVSDMLMRDVKVGLPCLRQSMLPGMRAFAPLPSWFSRPCIA